MEDKDWRLCGSKDHLHGLTLKKSAFRGNIKNDHEHCELCWEKFGEGDGMLREGYCTLDSYHWVCEECFDDLKDHFKWRVQWEDQKT